MLTTPVTRKRNTKVKTGCATCKIRKVKCDEQKPCCRRCVDTGRTCDGYESPFRFSAGHPITSAGAGGTKAVVSPRSDFFEITARDIDLLNRCFSTKTMFDVDLGCDDEARRVLQASLTDQSIRHAISSLKSLRKDFEISTTSTHQAPSGNYGLRQYCAALRGLANHLSFPASSNSLTSALLCCQIFISIEQVRGNFSAMIQHVTQGLSIMREHHARPSLDAVGTLVPAHKDQLPLLDVFIIKLFAIPCKFTEPQAATGMVVTTASEHHGECQELRTLAPDMRIRLTRIAASTLSFLDKLLHVRTAAGALELLDEKAFLLGSLESWLVDTELLDAGPELLSVSFMRLFHGVMRAILLGAIASSPDFDAELQIEKTHLRDIASYVEDGLSAYPGAV